jgi:hypothetical protein
MNSVQVPRYGPGHGCFFRYRRDLRSSGLAARGFDLLLVARDQQRLDNRCESPCVMNHGVKVEVLKADLTQKDDVVKLQQRLRSDSSISLSGEQRGCCGGRVAGECRIREAGASDSTERHGCDPDWPRPQRQLFQGRSRHDHQHRVCGGLVPGALQRHLQRQQSLRVLSLTQSLNSRARRHRRHRYKRCCRA